MSSQQSTIGIPFPQSNNDRDTSPSTSVSPIEDFQHRQMKTEGFASSSGQMSPPKAGYNSGGNIQPLRNTTQSNASTNSSASTSSHGGLPSIRNLLNSVNQEEQQDHQSSGHPFQLSNVRPNSPSSHHQRRQTVEGSQKGIIAGGHHHGHNNGPSSQSWDARMSLRSMSPPKRPPIAPSAYAHSQFISPANSTSQRPTSTIRQSPSSSSIGIHAGQQYPSGPSWNEGSQTSSSSSSSSLANLRASNTRWPGPPAPLIIHSPSSSISSAQAFNPSEENEQYGVGSLLAKRNIQAQKDLEEPPLSPAAIRRRHTVGAMDESYSSGVHPKHGIDVGVPMSIIDSRESVSTPRTFQPGRLASPIGHSNLESPTTPTAMNPMAHRLDQSGKNFNEPKFERGREIEREIPLPPPRVSSAVAVPQSFRNEGPSAVPHHMYMHHSTQSTGSMPSLSSSVSSASTTSERIRVQSLEGRFDNNNNNNNNQSHPPSAWNNQNVQTGRRTTSGSGSFVSPQSSVWHSRSSTLESIETNSSMGSTPSAKANFSLHAQHQSPSSAGNTDFTIRESAAPTTPKHHRSDYNRNWRFPNQQQQPERSPQHHVMPNSRTRHESLSRATSGRMSHYDEPLTAGYMPPSPFANLSLASPNSRGGGGGASSANAIDAGLLQQQQQQHLRPRAQTMTYTERRIAPLPSHSVHAQTSSVSAHHSHHPYAHRPQIGGIGFAGGSDFVSEHSIQPQRSYSSQSVGSLPNRVSSLEIAAREGEHVGGGGGMFEFQPLRRRLSSSGSRPTSATSTNPGAPSGTVIVSGSNVAVNSGSGSAKYECGWCGKRFSRPSSLKIHHHSHTGEKPFVCPEAGCGRTFSVQSNLRRHQKSHAANARKMNVGNASSNVVQSSGASVGNISSGPTVGRFPILNAPMSGGGGGSGNQIAQMGLSHSLSMPIVGATTGYHGQSGGGNNANIMRSAFRSFGADNQEYGSLRERKASVSSSYLGDDYEGEEEFDDLENEEHDSISNHSHSIRNPSNHQIIVGGSGEKRQFNQSEDTEMMQDIREENSTISLAEDDRPITAGSVNVRFQGLLNPPSR